MTNANVTLVSANDDVDDLNRHGTPLASNKGGSYSDKSCSGGSHGSRNGNDGGAYKQLKLKADLEIILVNCLRSINLILNKAGS